MNDKRIKANKFTRSGQTDRSQKSEVRSQSFDKLRNRSHKCKFKIYYLVIHLYYSTLKPIYNETSEDRLAQQINYEKTCY